MFETANVAPTSEMHPILRRVLADCRIGIHVDDSSIEVDTHGVEHSRCRHCGCELTRMPVHRRWFRSGLMG